MTVRKGIPRQGKHRKEPLRDKMSRSPGSVPTPEHAAEMRQEVNTLRELQYAELIDIRKQGCGKPNRIYPKSYEAVPNTDFKKSGYGTPED
ncbi:hypothetical protein CLOSYM_04720 [[Clostridium] symbiosum ATCC 14940]|uniref:Uncharacterized protein n=1 Tax=[Clostridium] symbiosum ATCC 14940 TaxID=411472 RepID=A0ABC9TQW7_CLOSY|nr:hypothetical protein CLOSYM_04720 [[Clostridium] symbiosum ATCC 14940]